MIHTRRIVILVCHFCTCLKISIILFSRNQTFKIYPGTCLKQHNFEGIWVVYTAEIAREYWNLGPRIIITIQTQGGIMKIIWNQIKLVCLLTNWFVIYPNFTYYSELLFIFANSKSLFLPPKTPFFFFFWSTWH